MGIEKTGLGGKIQFPLVLCYCRVPDEVEPIFSTFLKENFYPQPSPNMKPHISSADCSEVLKDEKNINFE